MQLDDELIQVLVGLHESVILGPELDESLFKGLVLVLNEGLNFSAVGGGGSLHEGTELIHPGILLVLEVSDHGHQLGVVLAGAGSGLDGDHEGVDLVLDALDVLEGGEVLGGAVLLALEEDLEVREGLLQFEVLLTQALEFHALVVVGEDTTRVHFCAAHISKGSEGGGVVIALLEGLLRVLQRLIH